MARHFPQIRADDSGCSHLLRPFFLAENHINLGGLHGLRIEERIGETAEVRADIQHLVFQMQLAGWQHLEPIFVSRPLLAQHGRIAAIADAETQVVARYDHGSRDRYLQTYLAFM
ncbi:hypothetical protein D3C80_1310970 [compost metagenome]